MSRSSQAVSLEELAYRQLRQALVEGVFAPGQKLSIRRIAAALGTSPMPARTALRRLMTEQAVDVLPSGTAIVPRVTRAAFEELGAVRALLEPLAVRMAAARLDRKTRDKLDTVLRAERDARDASDAEMILRADRQFLMTIYAAAQAPLLFAMIEATWLRRGPHFWDARWLIAGRQPGVARHAEMLALLKIKDGAAAAELLRTEIESTTEFLLKRMTFADDPSVRAKLRPVAGQ